MPSSDLLSPRRPAELATKYANFSEGACKPGYASAMMTAIFPRYVILALNAGTVWAVVQSCGIPARTLPSPELVRSPKSLHCVVHWCPGKDFAFMGSTLPTLLLPYSVLHPASKCWAWPCRVYLEGTGGVQSHQAKH